QLRTGRPQRRAQRCRARRARGDRGRARRAPLAADGALAARPLADELGVEVDLGAGKEDRDWAAGLGGLGDLLELSVVDPGYLGLGVQVDPLDAEAGVGLRQVHVGRRRDARWRRLVAAEPA